MLYRLCIDKYITCIYQESFTEKEMYIIYIHFNLKTIGGVTPC